MPAFLPLLGDERTSKVFEALVTVIIMTGAFLGQAEAQSRTAHSNR